MCKLEIGSEDDDRMQCNAMVLVVIQPYVIAFHQGHTINGSWVVNAL